MKYTYYFRNDNGDLNAQALQWCDNFAGTAFHDWQPWIAHGGKKVGIYLNDDDTALAFELAFNVKHIELGGEPLLKYIARS